MRSVRKRSHSIRAFELGDHSGPLRLIAFSDYRVQDIELFIEELAKLQPRPDLILYGGDDIQRFRPPNGKNLLEVIASYARFGLCAIAGNDDLPSVRTLISGKSVLNVHLLPARLGSYAILGLDGAPYLEGLGIGFILHSEQEIAKHLNSQHKAVAGSRVIVVSHAPPEGVLDRAVRFSKDGKPRSIGSRALRKFLKSRKEVALVICGHVHRCGGMHQRIHGTTVVNAANHDGNKSVARFAVIELAPAGQPTVEWREIRPASVVPGIGRVSVERLREIGIRTVEELAAASAELVCQTIPFGGHPREVLLARARAIVENRPILVRHLELTGESEVFLDIETDLEQSYVWLIGVCVGAEGKYHGFFAESPNDEQAILLEFLTFMEHYPNARILTCSGTRFDERVMRSRLSSYGLSDAVCGRMIDLHQTISRAVALPISSYGAKEIGAYFGYRYKHPDVDGIKVAMLYTNDYQKLRHALRREELKRRLREYNEDDVRCLPFILRAIESHFERGKLEGSSSYKAI